MLRNEYVGAIAIGFLLAQSIGVLIGAILRPIEFYATRGDRQHSVFGFSQSNPFPWLSLVLPATTFILYLLIVMLLLYWLYWSPAIESIQSEETTAAADLFE